VISEFMAANETVLTDGHGNYSDWVEIWNQGDSPAHLGGWRLTDSASNPSKFLFPDMTLAAGQRLVVMCSNKSGSTGASTHTDPLGYLHTNFALSAGGEYLALIRPDGTKSTEFAPSFPPQSDDLSYGIERESDDLVGATTQARHVVPTNGAYDTAAPNWTAAAYDDSSWSQASGPGLGFEAGVPVAYWRFDEGAGTTMAEDASGNGHHGSLTGSAAFGAAGQSLQTETAVSFANTLGKVTIPHSPALNPATFTFAAWVYPAAATGDYQSVITSRRGTSPSIGYVLYITPGGNWTFWTRGNSGGWSTLDGPAVSFGQWSHVAISRDAAGMNRLFVNGSEVAAAAGSYAPNPSSPLHFGAGNHDGSQFRLNGRIDDATFWKTALGTTLIQQHRDATGGSFPTAAYGGHYQTNVQDAMETVNPGLYARR
jgi:hypothetical protein